MISFPVFVLLWAQCYFYRLPLYKELLSTARSLSSKLFLLLKEEKKILNISREIGSKMGEKTAEVFPVEPTVTHEETATTPSKWKLAQSADGDTAMALFSDPDELHEAIDPEEERKLLWKIDFMILPYLAVCYAFFYIDKVGDPSQVIYLYSRR